MKLPKQKILIFTALLNIGINLIIVKPFGIFGASVSTVFAYAVGSVIFYFYSQKYYPLTYEWKRIAMIFGTGIILFLISYFLMRKLSYLNFFLKIILLLIYPVLLYLLGFYHKVEMERIRQFWRKWKNIYNLRENISSLNKADETLLDN